MDKRSTVKFYSSSHKIFSTSHATPLCPQAPIICAYPDTTEFSPASFSSKFSHQNTFHIYCPYHACYMTPLTPNLVLHELHKLQSSSFCFCLHYRTAVVTLLSTSFSLFSAIDVRGQAS